MVSPLKKQRDALLNAKQASHAVVGDTTANLDSLHLRLIEFEQDKLKLKDLVQIAQKVNHKREVLIPKYMPVAEQYLEAGESYQNPIFTDLIVWLVDTNDFDTAMAWCEKAIEKELPTPENFKCTWPTFIAREVLEWAIDQQSTRKSVEPYFSNVFTKLLEGKWVVPDKLYAEWLKFAGDALLLNDQGVPQPSQVGTVEQLEKAKAFLLKAQEVHGKCGVKSKIGKIDQRIRAIQNGRL
ncbi:phage terminase small subunit [Vibrio diazotrophicus]|uniref:phage terminase small subunit n=1 Tax=Vibrio diazotrophicus TaxID=685 RepID=UPI000C9E1955|nr:phage terminase small subunit [Vibrio diazotrophicus]PNH93100.1 terminase [Vibrio diazotrophicus]